MLSFDRTPAGPFDLENQVRYFGEWLHEKEDANAVVLPFPVEGWEGSAAVSLRQDTDGRIIGTAHGPEELLLRAQEQACACLSLDAEAAEWPLLGKRSPVIGGLQEKYRWLRPVLFHSPYEAAAGFIIGHRLTIAQKRSLMARMAGERGDAVQIGADRFSAFPGPRVLLDIAAFGGVSAEKIERLHGVARAALEGWLQRAHLRSLPVEEAREKLMSLRGVGPFFADGILHRGAGVVDEVPTDDLTPYAVQKAYGLEKPPDRRELLKIAEEWRPFRMWATVLLHVWLRREIGLPPRGGRRRRRGTHE